jgi:sec-independent protein translocase protein TatB
VNLPGGPELILIAIVALIILGPERLPIAARQAGAILRKLRGMTAGVRTEFDSVLAEPVRELRGLAGDTRNAVRSAIGDEPSVSAPGSFPPSLPPRTRPNARTSAAGRGVSGPLGSSPHSGSPRGQASTVTAPSLVDEGLTISLGKKQRGEQLEPQAPSDQPNLL